MGTNYSSGAERDIRNKYPSDFHRDMVDIRWVLITRQALKETFAISLA